MILMTIYIMVIITITSKIITLTIRTTVIVIKLEKSQDFSFCINLACKHSLAFFGEPISHV